MDDLLWPDTRITERVEQRADAMARAEVETVLHFGFHERFDFAPYFSLIHGLLADIAEALHRRGIRFIDHYSCNIVARPRGKDELIKYHTENRHHVSLHPGPAEAASFGYDGVRFDDIRTVDVETGAPAYTPYQSEAFCHNNPDFLGMHERYIARQLREIPLDGLMADDMCDYSYFRACGCPYCRERFRREFGHELAPLSDRGFWGDTSAHPSRWGNYDNPAFRDWVLQRYRTTSDHLARVKRVIGPDKILLTCCSSSGPRHLNSMGLSYESFIDACDWVLMENCGLTADTVKWASKEPEAMLHKAVSMAKRPRPSAPPIQVPAVAISYFLYPDGAYLGWAMARFWGVSNWASTLLQGPFPDPEAGKEEPELVERYNRWEKANGPEKVGRDVVEAAVAFTRETRDNGWLDDRGREHWERVRDWALALNRRDVGYRFVLSPELESAGALLELGAPLILDSCACLDSSQCDAIEAFVQGGGKVFVVPPLGTHDRRGGRRDRSLEERLRGVSAQAFRAASPGNLAGGADEALESLISDGFVSPRLARVSGPAGWAVRLRVHGGELFVHLLNRALQGVEHPSIKGRPSTSKVLHRIDATSATEPLEVEVRCSGLPSWRKVELVSPELEEPRAVPVREVGPDRIRLSMDLRGLRIYAAVRGV